jgi:hypothetical protein
MPLLVRDEGGFTATWNFPAHLCLPRRRFYIPRRVVGLRPVGFAETGPDSNCLEADDASRARSRGNPFSSGSWMSAYAPAQRAGNRNQESQKFTLDIGK